MMVHMSWSTDFRLRPILQDKGFYKRYRFKVSSIVAT